MSVQNAFKHNRDRKAALAGGMIIMICITLLSCVSSFMIYREGFRDIPEIFMNILSLFAVIVVEGAFIWLVHGYTRAFSSAMERLISLVGLGFLLLVMLTNITTHFMMTKHIPLSGFQQSWLDWGAVTVFIAVLIMVLLITLADPVIRLIRLEMRYLGKEQEVVLQAKTEGLDDEVVMNAMRARAAHEAEQLAQRIIGRAGVEMAPYRTMPASAPALAVKRGPKGRLTRDITDNSGKE